MKRSIDWNKIRRMERIRDLSYTTEPICPYCGEPWALAAWELTLYRDGQSTIVECYNEECEHEFKVMLNIEWTYTTTAMEGSQAEAIEKIMKGTKL